MKWEKTGRTVYSTGETTTIYSSDNGRYKIESRKRAIPHANREGYWMHTSYFLIDADGAEREFNTLRDAKAGVEA